MENTEFQQKSAELMTLCKNRGATVDTEDLIDAHHLDCIWYDGYGIIQISYKEHTISFDVCGDSYIGVQKNGVDYVVAHRGGSRPIYDDDEALEILENDETFYKLIEENNVVFENNNWVNIIIIGPNGDYVSEPEVADQDNLLYAALAAFEPCADYIDKLIAASAK